MLEELHECASAVSDRATSRSASLSNEALAYISAVLQRDSMVCCV